MSPDPDYVEINPADAARLEIGSNQRVVVSSRRGEARARAKLSENIHPGQLFMPMHFDQSNNLTSSWFDPYSHQPSYKYAAVSLKPAP
jgi:assimilatory nitrate reductase catalytic subunit